MSSEHQQWLAQLTALPTASGREDQVIAWVRDWAGKRKNVVVLNDRFGNLLLKRRGSRSAHPLVFTAHMDHPAFVVSKKIDAKSVHAQFRGGVGDAYFLGSKVRLFAGKLPPQRGKIVSLISASEDHPDKRVVVEFPRPVKANVGDVMTWDVPKPRVVKDRFHAPACDDLAGAAAAISAFDVLLKTQHGDAQVLLTRAEEVGFIGAIAACRSQIIPRRARLVTLENSKSFPESPIGGGPIVRVGDRTSTFDPDLTYRLGRIAEDLAKLDASFTWQRKLMPGGTCEASAFQAYGYRASCICLPLGNYHNMNETTDRIAAEMISLEDYRKLILLLVTIARTIDTAGTAISLHDRLDQLFARRSAMLTNAATTTRRSAIAR